MISSCIIPMKGCIVGNDKLPVNRQAFWPKWKYMLEKYDELLPHVALLWRQAPKQCVKHNFFIQYSQKCWIVQVDKFGWV